MSETPDTLSLDDLEADVLIDAPPVPMPPPGQEQFVEPSAIEPQVQANEPDKGTKFSCSSP